MAGAPLGGRDSQRHSPEWKGKKEEAAEEKAGISDRGGDTGGRVSSRRAGGSSMPLGPRGRSLGPAGKTAGAPEAQRSQSPAQTPLRTRLS